MLTESFFFFFWFLMQLSDHFTSHPSIKRGRPLILITTVSPDISLDAPHRFRAPLAIVKISTVVWIREISQMVACTGRRRSLIDEEGRGGHFL